MTVHDSRIIRPVIRWLALLFYRGTGWKVEGTQPHGGKYVIIGAPHTSNWDFIYTVCLAFIYRIKPTIMMKDAWFFWPMGPLFRWLGAIPIDRSGSNNVVAQCIIAMGTQEHMALVVPPSGTRHRVRKWKTGFYHIARGAGVPIALGFLDYRRKTGGFGPTIRPTGDLETDMVRIRRFYSGVSGKYPLKEYMAAAPVHRA